MTNDKRMQALYRNLAVIALAEMAVLAILAAFTGILPPDTPSYLLAYDRLIGGTLDVARTPVYPLVLGPLCALLGRTGGFVAVALLQSALFILSWRWFRYLATRLIPNPKVAFLMTAVYLLSPGPLSLCMFPLTESFALSGSVLLLYLLYRAVEGSAGHMLYSVAVMLTLLMLRPAFLYIPVAVAMLWIAAGIARRCRPAIWLGGLGGCILAGAMCWGYSLQIERLSGCRTMSVIGLTNTYITVREAGVLVPDEIKNDAVASFIAYFRDTNPKPADPMESVRESFTYFSLTTWSETDSIFTNGFRNHPEETLRYYLRKRLPDVCSSDAIYGGSSIILPAVRVITKYFSINVGATYFIYLLFLAMLTVADIRRRSFSLYRWYLAVMFAGINLVVILAGPNEWPRLLLPDIPVLLLISGIVLSAAIRRLSIPRQS